MTQDLLCICDCGHHKSVVHYVAPKVILIIIVFWSSQGEAHCTL